MHISWTTPGLPARVLPARATSHRISAAHDLIQASKTILERDSMLVLIIARIFRGRRLDCPRALPAIE